MDFRVTLDVSAQSERHVTEFAIQHLRERGYHVAPPNEKWETPVEFLRRLNANHETLRRALNRDGCPNAAFHRTRTGRLREICSNAAFDAFVKRHKKPNVPESSNSGLPAVERAENNFQNESR